MKLSNKIRCVNCPSKCDIYDSLKRRCEMNNELYSEINTIQITYKRHEQICRQGSAATHAIYLVNGSAKLYIEGLNNKNIILNIMTPHSYIGLLSFFESPHYLYSVMALEESTICMIELPLVKQLYIEDHQLLMTLNAAFGKSVAAIMNKMISLNQKQIRGRIAESILSLSDIHKSPTFNIGLTRKEIGEMSGVSEENAVRLLSELRKENIIEINGKELTILDLRILNKISEVG